MPSYLIGRRRATAERTTILKRLRRILQLPLSYWLCLVQSCILVVTINLALRLFSFQRVNRWLIDRSKNGRKPPQVQERVEIICWVVPRVSSVLLGRDSCLPRALAGQYLLRRQGLPVKLRLGVRRVSTAEIIAHAWVEDNGKILIGARGDPELKEFERFPEFG
jgi:hypothetical protein